MNLDLTQDQRKSSLAYLLPRLEEYFRTTGNHLISKEWNIEEIKQYVSSIDLQEGHEPNQAIEYVINGLEQYAVHTPHIGYLGLFNPRANFASILGDLITATYNPQLAAWSHAPFANEIEQRVIQEFGIKFGYPRKYISGTFASGGAESNLTALICALNTKYPDYAEKGLLGIDAKPVIYASDQSHHSINKAAKVVGLGIHSVRTIPTNADLKMDVEKLLSAIQADKKQGSEPLMIVGTGGTTGTGTLDDLTEIGCVAKKEDLWYHVDAAYGGAIIVSDEFRDLLKGTELSDSITLDLHKWFSVPMGASLFITNQMNALGKSFAIRTDYMPPKEDDGTRDPYVHSIQWSRRFIGLKFYLPLLVHGWNGYADAIEQQTKMGILLKERLQSSGWTIANDTLLPVVCFHHVKLSRKEMTNLCSAINASGQFWVSNYPIDNLNTVRACITNYQTDEKTIDQFVKLTNELKSKLKLNSI